MSAIQQVVSSFLPLAASGSSYRYWRVEFPYVGAQPIILDITETQLRATSGGSDVTTPSTPITSSGETQPVTNMLDGNTSTYWRSSGISGSKFFRIDLATPQTLEEIAIMPGIFAGANQPDNFIIQGSNDDVAFTNLVTYSALAGGWTVGVFRTFAIP